MRNRPNSHNGHSRTPHSRGHAQPITSRTARAAEAVRSYFPSDPTYRYGIPAGAALVGLAAAGILMRRQVFGIVRAVADSLSFDGMLEFAGLERRRSLPLKIAPAAGALALGFAAGAGASLLYVRAARDPHGPAIGREPIAGAVMDDGAMDVAP